jgi:hypothetical protein
MYVFQIYLKCVHLISLDLRLMQILISFADHSGYSAERLYRLNPLDRWDRRSEFHSAMAACLCICCPLEVEA